MAAPDHCAPQSGLSSGSGGSWTGVSSSWLSNVGPYHCHQIISAMGPTKTQNNKCGPVVAFHDASSSVALAPFYETQKLLLIPCIIFIRLYVISFTFIRLQRKIINIMK